jgi:hypothetical protein
MGDAGSVASNVVSDVARTVPGQSGGAVVSAAPAPSGVPASGSVAGGAASTAGAATGTPVSSRRALEPVTSATGKAGSRPPGAARGLLAPAKHAVLKLARPALGAARALVSATPAVATVTRALDGVLTKATSATAALADGARSLVGGRSGGVPVSLGDIPAQLPHTAIGSPERRAPEGVDAAVASHAEPLLATGPSFAPPPPCGATCHSTLDALAVPAAHLTSAAARSAAAALAMIEEPSGAGGDPHGFRRAPPSAGAVRFGPASGLPPGGVEGPSGGAAAPAPPFAIALAALLIVGIALFLRRIAPGAVRCGSAPLALLPERPG